MKHLKFFFALVVGLMGSVCSYADTFTVESAEGKVVEYTTEYSSSVIVAASSSVNQAIEGVLTIPDQIEYNGHQYTVTKIGSQAFKGNTKLTSVTIGNNVTNINESAFEGCTNLADVSFGTSLVRIDKQGFYHCTSLTSVEFPDGMKSFGRSAFCGSGLSCGIVFPSSLITVEEQAFAWTDITSVKFQSGVEIKAGAFDNCESITDYYFSPAVLKPVLKSDYSYGSPLTINANTKIHVSQATLSMLENKWYTSSPLQSYYNSSSSFFVPYESTEGAVFMSQIAMADNEGDDVGSLALCFTVTSTDESNPTAALYCPPSTGYSADELLKSGSNSVIKNNLTADGKLIIPETVTDRYGKEYTVTVIGADAFAVYGSNDYSKIAGLKLPKTLTHIGVRAFRYLQYLSGILIVPASVRQIGHPGVARAELFYQEQYGEVKVPGIYMMHTSASGIDWYETHAEYYLAYNYSGTQTTLNVCQEIYDKAYGYNGATRYPSTSAFRSWLTGGWNGSSQVKLFDPTKLGLKWNTEQTVVDISGEYEAPELENPFGLPVTYSSSHPSVADIDAETGEITLGTAEGSTTLTATFAGNEEYTTEVSVQTVIIRRGEPMLAEDQENHNEFNTCEALTKVTRWTPNPELYMENNMWEMPHMMDGKFYVSAFWQSNNDSEMSEWFPWNEFSNDEKYLQLSCSPAYLSPNYGLDYVAYINHDLQPGSTFGGFICFKVKGPGTIIVRGFTESDKAMMGICVQGNIPLLFSGTEDREISYDYSLDAEKEAYAFVYGVSLSPTRHGYIRYIKFVPEGTVMADVSVGGIAIEEESDDVLDDGGSVGFEWREEEEGEEIDGGDVKRYVDMDDADGDDDENDSGEGETPATPKLYPVLILKNANITSADGPVIEVNSHDRFLIELRGNNTITASNGSAAISMGTLQSEAWGGGTISIVGLEDGAKLTIPAVEGVENGIYLAESSIYVENLDVDISGSDYGVRFQGYDMNDYDNLANCEMTLGKGVSVKMRGGEAALSGFAPQSMSNLSYYDEENDDWIEYFLLESDMEYPEIIFGERGGVYGTEEWVDVVNPEDPEGSDNPEDPEGSEGEYNSYRIIVPAKYLYFGVRPEMLPIPVNSFGMTTFCSTMPLDFTNVEDLKAYVASDFDPETNELTLTRIYEVPERTGIVIYGEEGTYNVPVDEPYKYYEPFINMLVGCTVDTYIQPTEEDYTNFVLSKLPEDDFLGFYRFTTTNPNGRKMEAGKAYLQIETADVVNSSDGDGIKGFTIAFDDAPTAIASPHKEMNEENAIYDLAGRRLTRLGKGVNIVGGKKIIVK